MSAATVPTWIASGEILPVPAELAAAIDEAAAAAATAADDAAARTAFGPAFAEALHRRGLVLVSFERPGGRAR